MASVENSWTPPPAGIYDVSVGQSLSRALKARKGEPVRSKVERELYSFRYNFRPESVDTVANGTISVKKGDDKAPKVSVERASLTEPAGCSFVGTAPAAKEFDCVIIFDAQTMSFTMEKVDSSVLLVYDRKTSNAPRNAPSPMPTSSAASSRPSTSTSSSTALASQVSSRPKPLRQPVEDVGGADEDAEGEIDDDFLDILPVTAQIPSSHSKKTVEKDTSTNIKGKQTVRKPKADPLPPRVEDESEPEEALSKQVKIAPPSAPKPKTQSKARPKKSAPMTKAEKAAAKLFHNFPKPRQAQLPSQAASISASAKPAPTATAPLLQPVVGMKRERDLGLSAADTSRSAVAITGPAPRAKRPRVQPAAVAPKAEKPRETLSLALPGSEFNLPSSVSAPTSLTATSVPSAAPAASVLNEPAAPAEDSDEDGGWDVVVPTSTSAPTLSVPASPPSQPVRSIQMEVIIPTSEAPPDVQDSDGLAAADDDFLQDMFDEAGDAEAEDETMDDDFLQDAMIEESRAPPKSMNELAQVELGDLWPDDDDDDTSDDSESDDE